MNPTYIKRIVIATRKLSCLLISYFLKRRQRQKSLPLTTIYQTIHKPQQLKHLVFKTLSKPLRIPPKVTEPAAPVALTENSAATSTIANKINVADLKVQYLNPEAPCPAKQMSCYALPGGMTIDASLPHL